MFAAGIDIIVLNCVELFRDLLAALSDFLVAHVCRETLAVVGAYCAMVRS
jgi:hypothetical protein